MFAYYFDLALRSFRRNKALTTLMVLAIALGIGASMTTLTVFHVLSGDPLPSKSSELFFVQLDPASMDGYTAGEEPEEQVTRFDAEELLRQKRGDRQALISESADLLYHWLVVLAIAGVPLADVLAELERRTGRSGLAEKASRGAD